MRLSLISEALHDPKFEFVTFIGNLCQLKKNISGKQCFSVHPDSKKIIRFFMLSGLRNKPKLSGFFQINRLNVR